ncbi:hypothetical protein D6C76_10142 [Aureobasidium pullulans]|nr:hypothetical protein D6C76_10142 [Aureobasidium pullulans]
MAPKSGKPKKIDPPPQPTNPFPRVHGGSWAEFRPGRHNAKGQPNGGKYHTAWRAVEIVIKQIKTSDDPGRATVRDFIDRIVEKTDQIDSAVCVGLGPYQACMLKETEAFNHQLAMFIAIRERLERKYKKEIPMVFQDPRFRTPEEYLLQHIIGGKVVQHPECLQYMTEKSFVFAPYLTWEGFASTVLLRRPALYIGNNLENTGGTSIALAKTYVRQVYLTGNYEMGTDLHSLILQTNAFSEYYDKYEFDATHDSIYKNNFKKHFENIWVHHPKEKNLPHPRQVSLGSSSAAPGPSELGPRNDSDDGSNETPPGPSAPIFTSI